MSILGNIWVVLSAPLLFNISLLAGNTDKHSDQNKGKVEKDENVQTKEDQKHQPKSLFNNAIQAHLPSQPPQIDPYYATLMFIMMNIMWGRRKQLISVQAESRNEDDENDIARYSSCPHLCCLQAHSQRFDVMIIYTRKYCQELGWIHQSDRRSGLKWGRYWVNVIKVIFLSTNKSHRFINSRPRSRITLITPPHLVMSNATCS